MQVEFWTTSQHQWYNPVELLEITVQDELDKILIVKQGALCNIMFREKCLPSLFLFLSANCCFFQL